MCMWVVTSESRISDSDRARALMISAARSSSPRPSPQPSGRRRTGPYMGSDYDRTRVLEAIPNRWCKVRRGCGCGWLGGCCGWVNRGGPAGGGWWRTGEVGAGGRRPGRAMGRAHPESIGARRREPGGPWPMGRAHPGFTGPARVRARREARRALGDPSARGRTASRPHGVRPRATPARAGGSLEGPGWRGGGRGGLRPWPSSAV